MQYRSAAEIPTLVATGRERLERLATFLDVLPPDRLTFSRWYGQQTGCAVGLAAARDPWFRAQGLRLERDDSLKDCRPAYRGEADWRAVMSFFGISREGATRLFGQAGYDGEMQPHPKKVAGKIRDYLTEATRLAAFA